MPKFIIISLEGNIGAGKSTLFNIIKKQYPNAFYLCEPLEAWQSINNNPNLNLLDSFYKNTQRWCHSFQTYAYQSMLLSWDKQFQEFKNKINQSVQQDIPQLQLESQINIKKQDTYIVFSERSIQSSRCLFLKNAYKLGFVNDLEYHIYEEFYQWMMQKYTQYKVDQVIYINTPAEECLNRLKRRGRNEEVGVTLDYLSQLEQRHIEWFKDDQRDFQILDIDATANYISDENIQKRVIEQIHHFIKKIQNKSQ